MENDNEVSAEGTSGGLQAPPAAYGPPSRVPALLKVLVPSMSLAVVILGTIVLVETIQRRKLQIQNDPHVAASWLVGVRYGSDCSFVPHDGLATIVTRLGLRIPRIGRELSSRYNGVNGSMEVWLGYVSHVANQSKLQCAPVGQMAFFDNLGQSYRGFLDLHKGYTGLFLPGYDHAAKTLTCVVHWLPNINEPSSASKPMRFFIKLPKARRVLPLLTSVGYSAIDNQHGVTVGISHVRLSEALNGGYSHGQRELTFHLHLAGGVVWARNMNMDEVVDNSEIGPSNSAGIVDPYGMNLVLPHTFISRMRSFLTGAPFSVNHASVWVAPVSGAGVSTDMVQFNLPVKPANASSPIVFHLLVRLRQDLVV